MMMTILMTFIFFIIPLLIFFLSWILSKKTFLNREKTSPFECGFDPKTFARIPFTLLYFLIIIIFLIFDVEITLLIPMISTFSLTNLMNMTMLMLSFIIILLYGLYHEWYQKALTWMK
uniref:NADH-ubiquinone oxidoreductase chain 3 n=1 Tax=Passalidae sp. GENSP01 TaxID=1205571 RepID=A0A0S2MRQ1_9SCAR|nr:NADH deshydrogenase subunit 3 [Passalidae sp. GENSP01]